MADRYWVGGTGTWDATTTTNWSATSGGAGGASAPTSADNVIFNSASNATLYTVTVGTDAACADLTAAGPTSGNVTFSLGATAVINCHGSMTLPATGLTWTGVSGCLVTFRATTTGKTVTTNGVSLASTNITFDGVGGAWALGSALTATGTFTVTNGTFDSANYNITYTGIASSNSNIRSITLGSSTVTLTGSAVLTFTTSTNLTFNAGTSSIVCSGASPTFVGGGQTFYNVSFTSAASGITTINGANTFNNLTFTSRSTTGLRFVTLSANQTVNGTLTLGASNTAIRRINVQSDVVGTQRTITLNGTLATLADVDFRDINAAGTVATPWTGTRLGNGLNNNNITFDAPKTVYWNLAGTQNWSATGWATTNNGTPAVNNFPLPQDTATFTEAGAAGTVTIELGWNIGSIQMADGVSNRTTAFTLTQSGSGTQIYGNITLFSNLTLSGTGLILLVGQGTTQTITSAGVSFTQPITINSPNGTVQLLANLTCSATVTLTSGTLNLNNFNLTCNVFGVGAGTSTKVIAFGSGVINVSGRNTTVLLNSLSGSGFSYTGTPRFNLTGVGIGGETRSIQFAQAVYNETNAVDVYVTAGADTIATGGTGFNIRTLDFTGFSGTFNRATSSSQFGNLIISSGMTLIATTSVLTFAATSGTQLITTNGKTLDFPITQNGVGGTVQLQDNLTMGSTRTFTLTAGTLDLSSGNRTLSTGIFSSNNTNVRSIAFGTGNITVTGNAATVVNLAAALNFSYTGTPNFNGSYSGSTGTRNFLYATSSGNSSSTAPNFNVTAGTDTVFIGYANSINFTGFSGTFTNVANIIYGDLTFSSGMTAQAGTGAINFSRPSGTQNITTNGITLDFPITQDGAGGTVQIQDNLTMASNRTYTLTRGTLDINDKVLSAGLFSLANSNTRAIDFGLNGQLLLTGTGTAFNAATSTGLSIAGTGAKISMNSPTAKTFAGGSFVYPVTLEQSGLGNLTITGANTFDDMTNTVQPCTIIFPASTTTSFKAFNVNGTAGNLVSLRSSTSGTRCVLAKV